MPYGAPRGLPTLCWPVPVKMWGRNREMRCCCSWDRDSGQSRRIRLVGGRRGSPAALGTAGRHRAPVVMMARMRMVQTFTFMALRLRGDGERRLQPLNWGHLLSLR